jgi:hypothetical protein
MSSLRQPGGIAAVLDAEAANGTRGEAKLAMSEVTYVEAIRQALWEEMERDDRVFLMGEDIGRYGGAF